MKKSLYYAVVILGTFAFIACNRKPADTQAAEKKRSGPVIELKDEIQAPTPDTTGIQQDTTQRKKPAH